MSPRRRLGAGDLLLGAAALVLLSSSLAFVFHLSTPKRLPLLAPYLPPAPEGVTYLSLFETKDLFDQGTATFVDAREEELYRAGHIQGAVSLPADGREIPSALVDTLRAARSVVLYCDGPTCGASRKLAQKLSGLGLGSLSIFNDGWPAWEAAGYPAVGEQS